MSRWLWLSLLLLVAVVAADEEEDPGDVVVLDESNFAEGVNKDIVLVEFYAPWCGHCKRLAPEYKEAATKLLKEDPPVPLAKVDCPANSALCQKYGVSGYPTLKIFRNGEVSADYQGPRQAAGIVSYMKKQSGPSSVEVSSVEQLKTKLDKSAVHCIVGFFSEESSTLRDAFIKAADKERDNFKFVYTSGADVLKEYGYNEQVVIFQPSRQVTKMEPAQLPYDGKPKADSLVTFIHENFMGLAGVRTPDNVAFFAPKQPLVVVYFDVDFELNPKGSNYWRNRVIKVAKEFDGVTFSVSNKADFSQELSALGLDSGAAVVAGVYDKLGKYSMETDFSVENLRGFVQDYLDEKLELYIKSEPLPKDNDGPVTVIVGKNFNEIVNDDSKDVLLEFYAPWCGHCKALAPKFEELGEKFKDDPNIVIAKTDATANDYPPQYEVRGYPTLFWIPAGKKDNPVKYEGGREVADFVKYIKENATNPPVISGEEEKKKKKKKTEL